MVVGTVFIMVFGMATLTMVESIDESVKNSEFELSEPEVTLLSVTDKQESTGPVLTVSLRDYKLRGHWIHDGDQCELPPVQELEVEHPSVSS